MSAAKNKIGIICPLMAEAKFLLDAFGNAGKKRMGKFSTFSIRYNSARIVIVVSGMGKVSSVKAVQCLINEEKPDYIINFGTAGGLAFGINVGDIVISSQIIQYDEEPPFTIDADKNLLKLSSDLSVKIGITMSGEKNIDSLEERNFLAQKYNALCCDWESAAVMREAGNFNVPAIAFRVVSDVGRGQPLMEEFKNNLAKVMPKASLILKELLNKMAN